MNRRILNGTYGGVKGRELAIPSYSITISLSKGKKDISRYSLVLRLAESLLGGKALTTFL